MNDVLLLLLGGYIAGGLVGMVLGFWFWSKKTDRVIELVLDKVISSGGFRKDDTTYTVEPYFFKPPKGSTER